MDIYVLLNIVVFFAGVASLLMVAKHYAFYRRAIGNELGRRVMIVFLSQTGNVVSVLSYKLASVLFGKHRSIEDIYFALNLFQLFTTLFSAWAAYRLYSLYEIYKNKDG